MKKQIISLIFAICLVLPMIFAQPIYKQNGVLDLKIQCIINGTYCSGSGVCYANILYPNSSLFIDNILMTNQLSYHNSTLPAPSELGEYKCSATCCDGGLCGTNACDFLITPSGNISTSGEAVTYIVLILVVLFFFVLCLIGAIKIKGGNEYDIGGNLMSITYGKYLKMGLFWFSIVLLWVSLYLGWEVSNKVLMFGFVGDVFHTAFLILTWLIAPSFIAFTILAIVQWTADMKLWEMAERGLKPR